MRTGISITVSPSDRQRLEATIRDRTAPRKHVWRARIVLLTADGLGVSAIMRETGKSKTCVWRWQERFMEEGVDGLQHPGIVVEDVEQIGAVVGGVRLYQAGRLDDGNDRRIDARGVECVPRNIVESPAGHRIKLFETAPRP